MDILTKAAKNYVALHKLTCKMEMKKFLVSGLKHTKHIAVINNSLIYYSGIGFGIVTYAKVDLCWIDWLEDKEAHPKKFNIVKDKNFKWIYFSESIKKSVPYFDLTPSQLKKKIERDKIQLEELRQRKEQRNREIQRQEEIKKYELIQKENAKKLEEQRIENERIQKENAIRLEKEAELKRIYEEQKKDVFNALNKNLSTADEMMEGRSEQWCKSYKQIKLEWLRQIESHRWHDKTSQNYFSDAQLNAIGDMSKYCLLRARAGSGKTTVVKHKIDLLITRAGIQPNEVMALAFNKSAATKINKELQSQFDHITFNNSRTFHSLAHRIVKPTKELLYDENNGTQAKQSHYIESLLRDELNPAVVEMIYDFFRREMTEIENLGSLLSKSEYYQLRRNATLETLGGEQVKSIGEKWIADFLYEHGLRYMYERAWGRDASKKEGNYYPDFSIAVQQKGTDVVLEHWGIDEYDPAQSIPKHWSKSWEMYRQDMHIKRQYWADKKNKATGLPIVFLETSIRDTRGGREKFEAILKKKFTDIGVVVKKLPVEQLHENVVRRRVPKLAKLLAMFIQKAKQSGLSPNDVDHKVSQKEFACEREKIFVSLASRIYHRYQNNLANRIDYNDLMREAVDIIHEKQGALSIKSDNQSSIKLDGLKWIIIDEYQDFSQLFLNLIDALRKYNPDLNIFCVGDDWQAINGFAGSETKFFSQFDHYFDNANKLDLPDNYRSQKKIVEQANRFMKNESGQPSVAMRTDISSFHIERFHTCDTFIDFSDSSASYLRFKTFEANMQKRNLDPGFEMARLFRTCWEIMSSHSLADTTFMILSRSDYLAYSYQSMYDFKRKLKSVFYENGLSEFQDFDRQVNCSTVHKSKGLEADVVIVLNVNERRFPIVHPDNQLYSLFGVTMSGVYKEERRLFYVALTRAKHMTYLLHEKNLKSEFVSDIESRLVSLNKDLDKEDQSHNISSMNDHEDIPF